MSEIRTTLEKVEKAYDLQDFEVVLQLCQSIEQYDRSGSTTFWLGLLYRTGEGVPLDREKSKGYFTAALKSLSKAENDSIAQTNLGWLYRNATEAIERDDVVAFRLYLSAANQGLPRAQYNLGRMYQEGRGTEANLNEAMRYFEAACESGYASAQFFYGHLRHAGVSFEMDQQKGLKWLLAASRQGEPNALYEVGWMYFHGKDVEEDRQKALDFYSRSAAKGNSSAHNNLGWMYEKGYVVDRNLTNAIHHYEISTARGNASAPYNLARILEQIPEKRNEAENLFRLSAMRGNVRAPYCLARFLYHTGVDEKRLEAKSIWEFLISDKNCAHSRFDMALCHLQGVYCAPDPVSALLLLKQAQEQGHEGAKRKISELMSVSIQSEDKIF